MKTSEFSFDLPEQLIAQQPPFRRGSSRLMVVNRATETIEHTTFSRLPLRIPADSLIIFNDTRVNKARLTGRASATGGRVEFLLLRRVESDRWLVISEKSRKQKRGKSYNFPGDLAGWIESEEGQFKALRFDRDVDEEYLRKYAAVPLPPYIKRQPKKRDDRRYQTVFAVNPGSAAAPTAGLHFTRRVLKQLEKNGTETAHITLSIGAGTFVPIRSLSIENHKMHEETYSITGETAARLNDALERKKPIVAVGTTVVRALESAFIQGDGRIQAGDQTTGLYITPGFRFRVISHLFTNFHTPRSSLLVLVSAFTGTELIKQSYWQAVKERYRFFSYGDGMYIV